MASIKTNPPPQTSDNVSPLQKLADKEKWSELSESAESIATYHTRTLFIAALELAVRGNNSEALAAVSCINPPMAALIRAIIENDLSIILSSQAKNIIADAWVSLAETVATTASEAAALKYVSLAPIVQNVGALSTAANHFFINRYWKPAACLYVAVCSASDLADVAILRQLGISKYLSKDYEGSITAFSKAVDNGDTSPETSSYITWLEEKFSPKEN